MEFEAKFVDRLEEPRLAEEDYIKEHYCNGVDIINVDLAACYTRDEDDTREFVLRWESLTNCGYITISRNRRGVLTSSSEDKSFIHEVFRVFINKLNII